MWVLALAFNICLDTQPACDPQYVYVAHFATREECEARIHPGDDALRCMKKN